MIAPSEDAQRVGDTLVEAAETQREILIESAETGTESGRSVCGGETREPDDSGRGFKFVTLPGCSEEESGILHGGGGHDFKVPEHSLIDVAIVLFGWPQASLVVGSEESDLFLAPDEKTADEAIASFQDALGYPVNSIEDVREVIEEDGFSPSVSRMLVRDQLNPLFSRHPTYHEIDPEELDVESPEEELEPEDVPISQGIADDFHEALVGLWRSVKGVFTFDLSDAEVNLAQVLVSQIATAIVLFMFLKAFGGSPREKAKQRAA